jgi:hypothetical protein
MASCPVADSAILRVTAVHGEARVAAVMDGSGAAKSSAPDRPQQVVLTRRNLP